MNGYSVKQCYIRPITLYFIVLAISLKTRNTFFRFNWMKQDGLNNLCLNSNEHGPVVHLNVLISRHVELYRIVFPDRPMGVSL